MTSLPVDSPSHTWSHPDAGRAKSGGSVGCGFVVTACSHRNFSFVKECAGVAGDAVQLGESLPRMCDTLGSIPSTPPNRVRKCQGEISQEVAGPAECSRPWRDVSEIELGGG